MDTSNKEQEAKEAWKRKVYDQSTTAGRHNYLIGILEFQSILIEMLEKEIAGINGVAAGTNDMLALSKLNGILMAFNEAISLVKTIKPKTE